jgi:hypothetical protein
MAPSTVGGTRSDAENLQANVSFVNRSLPTKSQHYDDSDDTERLIFQPLGGGGNPP